MKKGNEIPRTGAKKGSTCPNKLRDGVRQRRKRARKGKEEVSFRVKKVGPMKERIMIYYKPLSDTGALTGATEWN